MVNWFSQLAGRVLVCCRNLRSSPAWHHLRRSALSIASADMTTPRTVRLHLSAELDFRVDGPRTARGRQPAAGPRIAVQARRLGQVDAGDAAQHHTGVDSRLGVTPADRNQRRHAARRHGDGVEPYHQRRAAGSVLNSDPDCQNSFVIAAPALSLYFAARRATLSNTLRASCLACSLHACAI